MANHTTGAERYNNRMDKIFSRAKELEAISTKAYDETIRQCRIKGIKAETETRTRGLVQIAFTDEAAEIFHREYDRLLQK
jgi:hypothetical protein